ncbi:MAG: MmcQ/YjbR family DNA-binding protein [Mariprofundaceae bacterium]|nr:MmcQ/YjbR family DNA-binding protein [Mariprofundaceae bacterium]
MKTDGGHGRTLVKVNALWKASPMLFAPDPNIEAYMLAKKSAEKSYPFGRDVAVFKVKNKMFALIGERGINLKCDPDEAIIYRSMFDAVRPAYHMNKEHWNTVALESDMPEDLIHKMIDDSYALVVAKLPKKDQNHLIGDTIP